MSEKLMLTLNFIVTLAFSLFVGATIMELVVFLIRR